MIVITQKDFMVDFVCFRGLLTTLMCTPYERRDGWEFNAVKFKKTIYLCAVETDQKKSQRLNESQRQKDMCSWGFKFEQYVLSDEPRISDPNHDVFSDESSSGRSSRHDMRSWTASSKLRGIVRTNYSFFRLLRYN